MGTTVEKADYAFETKDLLKTEINKINNVLDDNSTFRSYPQELFNGYLDILNNGTDTLWNNLEKVSASGEEATLENVETAPMKVELQGNTSQDTTNGKNLFDQTTNQLFNVSRITWGTNIPQIVDLLNSLNEGQYALSYKVKFDSLDSQTSGERIIGFIIANSVSGNINTRRNETVRINEIYNAEGIITITASNKGSFTNCYLYSSTSSTADYSTTYDVQLEQGSATSYEPYTGGQPSPSPDFPQQVKVVKGENVVSVHGKNLFDIDTITKNKTINLDTGEVDTNANDRDTSDFILVTNSVTYSCNVTMTRIAFYDKSKNFISMKAIQPSVVTPDNCKYVRFSYDNSLSNIQFERGLSTEFTPYAKTYPISLGTLELCKINTYKDYFHKDSGKWYEHKEIGKVVLDGSETWTQTPTQQSVYYITSITNYRLSNNIPMCNYFVGKANVPSPTGLVNLGNNNVAFIGNTSAVRFYLHSSMFNSVSDLKTWLSTHNTIVYYVLATPTETEITNTTLIEQLEAISKAKSVKDKTYITQTNDELPFILDVEAIKEYEVN